MQTTAPAVGDSQWWSYSSHSPCNPTKSLGSSRFGSSFFCLNGPNTNTWLWSEGDARTARRHRGAVPRRVCIGRSLRHIVPTRSPNATPTDGQRPGKSSSSDDAAHRTIDCRYTVATTSGRNPDERRRCDHDYIVIARGENDVCMLWIGPRVGMNVEREREERYRRMNKIDEVDPINAAHPAMELALTTPPLYRAWYKKFSSILPKAVIKNTRKWYTKNVPMSCPLSRFEPDGIRSISARLLVLFHVRDHHQLGVVAMTI